MGLDGRTGLTRKGWRFTLQGPPSILMGMIPVQLSSNVGAGSVFSFGCAELFMLLVRSREITVLLKRDEQRSLIERQEVSRGLSRAVLLEGFVYLPASVLLVLITVRPLVLLIPFIAAFEAESGSQALYGLLGILSYQFPFAVMKRIITRIALNTLRSFAQIALKEEGSLTDSEMAVPRKALSE